MIGVIVTDEDQVRLEGLVRRRTSHRIVVDHPSIPLQEQTRRGFTGWITTSPSGVCQMVARQYGRTRQRDGTIQPGAGIGRA